MNRRSFLAAMAISPVGLLAVNEATAGIQKPCGIRISCIRGDEGYRAFCKASGDGKKVKCFLNGVEERNVVTADESLGMIHRVVTTESGNIAVDRNAGEILHETVYGDVRVVIE